MPDRSRRRFLATTGTLAVGAVLGSAGCATPRVPGVVVVDHDWVDPVRSRAVPARLYLPSAAPDAALPPLVFSHGIGGSREGYSYLGTYLASAGIATLHVQHVGSDRRLWWQGAPFGVVDRLRQAAMEVEARARVDDIRFALDQMLGAAYGNLLDERSVFAAGH